MGRRGLEAKSDHGEGFKGRKVEAYSHEPGGRGYSREPSPDD